MLALSDAELHFTSLPEVQAHAHRKEKKRLLSILPRFLKIIFIIRISIKAKC